MQNDTFYLGKWSPDGERVEYDPADLTTHAVVIGMTGSGKTGLLIALLEEAARKGIPAIVVDPKGDLTNLLLHFPEMRAEDFAPWIDPETARRAGEPVETLAAETAERWRKGLAEWNLGRADLEALRDKVDYAVYTPGSTAGTPVNLLSSFEAPADAEANPEGTRERIASIVTALLGLIGMNNLDPLRSREHILLANIIEQAWNQGKSLDLAELIEEVQQPPFDRLGAFPLERVFPQKERFELALMLNNFLAAPSFQTWLEGERLDINRMLYTPEGKPRFSIFYLAHLDENGRMFFVTLLMTAVESWMRAQRGTSGLRALVAFDEITGYLPPVANPPSRPVLLRLLKQGRAFGLGLVLATQNPTDLNYKALSNAGTWFIGRLQTEQDKQRLLDGLQSLEGGIDRGALDPLIGGLKPRLFLLHNIHRPAEGPNRHIMQTRRTLNYLAGPLARGQISLVNGRGKPVNGERGTGVRGTGVRGTGVPGAAVDGKRGSGVLPEAARGSSLPPVTPVTEGGRSGVKVRAGRVTAGKSFVQGTVGAGLLNAPPVVPAPFTAAYFPAAVSIQRALAAQGGAFRGPLEPQGLVYKPALLAQAQVRYYNQRYKVDLTRRMTCLVTDPGMVVDWQAYARPPLDASGLPDAPAPNARFAPLPASVATARGLSALRRDFLDWVYRAATVYARVNENLKVYAGPDIPDEVFRREVDAVMRAGLQEEMEKIAAGYDQKLETLARKVEKQQLIVDRRGEMVGQRKAEQASTDLELIASVFTRRKRSVTTSLTRRRMTEQARGELGEAKKALADLQAAWKSLAEERRAVLERARADWQERAARVSQVAITPLKKDIFPDPFCLVWLPYYLVKGPDGEFELAAY